ncbi:MAG: hypothetical protein DWQ02_22400 [Bacteroidetes bacterium]|nr:MAG: hypothetical protein DWQ02_22400 [Bacteroidota bacterium]
MILSKSGIFFACIVLTLNKILQLHWNAGHFKFSCIFLLFLFSTPLLLSQNFRKLKIVKVPFQIVLIFCCFKVSKDLN